MANDTADHEIRNCADQRAVLHVFRGGPVSSAWMFSASRRCCASSR